jgi:light-regulated signal transduction histidine kinase (bacteriophytochrome)
MMIKQAEKEQSAARAVDAELRRVNAQLTRRIERHAEELCAAQAEMDAFARSVSHDLRSPLTVICGFAELLTKHSGPALDEKGRHYLERITTAVQQVGLTIGGIFALSQMSRSEMHYARIDLEALVGRVVHDLDGSKGDRRVVWLLGPLPWVEADPTLLRLAIASLVSNALSFTRSREVARIQTGALAAHDGDSESTFFVRDNGAAMNTKYRERMFGASRGPPGSSPLDSSATSLPYVQRIIQRHGGRTWSEAVPDGGATFFFSLPNGRVEAGAGRIGQ